MKRKLIFCVFLVFFTIFGGGRVYRWTYICEDSQGWLYEVDRQQISRKAEGQYELRVRASKGEHSFVQDWFLDIDQQMLKTDSDSAQKIRSGSVAYQVVLYLNRSRKKTMRGTGP